MPKNTGHRSGAITGRQNRSEWTDISHLPWVVWVEPEGVVVYEGEKDTATRRRVLTPDEARGLADLLRDAADEA
jgi:hypothetical protein